jgi:hypothetical protein
MAPKSQWFKLMIFDPTMVWKQYVFNRNFEFLFFPLRLIVCGTILFQNGGQWQQDTAPIDQEYKQGDSTVNCVQ